MKPDRRPIATVWLALSLLWSCNLKPEEAREPPNFLILIGDDMGVETLSCYGVGSAPAVTPRLDQLCDTGMRFDNFWSQPVCSPTRATMLSGQYGFRSGVGTPVTSPDIDYPVPPMPANAAVELAGRRGDRGRGNNREIRVNPNAQRPGYAEPANERPGLSPDVYALPAALAADTSLSYRAAALGKWHLATDDNGGLEHANIVGFDYYSGSYAGGAVESYFAWSKVINGKITDGETGYATSATVDDALAWLADRGNDGPWLLWVAFNAPHSPFGAPPANLLSEATATKLQESDVADDTHLLYAAMIEAMDTEIGRLLDSIGEDELANTYVIFLGDNGTPSRTATPPFTRRRVKGTVYEGGIHVPLIVSGPVVDGGTVSKSLANSVDIYSTILELAGVSNEPALDDVMLDSVSLVPAFRDHTAEVRDYAYADVFGPQQNEIVNARAIRNRRFKLIQDLQDDTRELYDLQVDPYEANDLMLDALGKDGQKNYDELAATLERLLSNH